MTKPNSNLQAANDYLTEAREFYAKDKLQDTLRCLQLANGIYENNPSDSKDPQESMLSYSYNLLAIVYHALAEQHIIAPSKHLKLANEHVLQGNTYYAGRKYDEALEQYHNARVIQEKKDLDGRMLANTYRKIAYVYFSKGKEEGEEKALKYFLKSAKILEKFEPSQDLMEVCENILRLCEVLKKLDTAEYHKYEKLLETVDLKISKRIDLEISKRKTLPPESLDVAPPASVAVSDKEAAKTLVQGKQKGNTYE